LNVAILALETRRHARWIRRTRAGDVLAFRRLYAELYPPIERYVARRVSTPADRDDIVASCFERLLDHLDQFDERKGSVRMWAFGVARNLVADHRRARARAHVHDPEVLERRGAEAAADDPLAELLRDESVAALRDVVSALDAPQRELLALRFGEELRHAEIARVMGLSEANVRQRLSRLQREMKRRLEAAQGAPDHVY